MPASPTPFLTSICESSSSGAVDFVPRQLGDFELRQIAEFLADAFLYDIEAAVEHPTRWYREQVGEEVCSVSRAIRLRQLTIEACKPLAEQELNYELVAPGAGGPWKPPQMLLLVFVALAGAWLSVCAASAQLLKGGVR